MCLVAEAREARVGVAVGPPRIPEHATRQGVMVQTTTTDASLLSGSGDYSFTKKESGRLRSTTLYRYKE